MNITKQITRKVPGFTIVELLIVIVVIAILAAISIVAYNGIQERARASAASSAAAQAAKKISVYAVENSNYPATLNDIGISNSSSTTYQYVNNNLGYYCVGALYGTTSYYVSTLSSNPQEGLCNQLGWIKPQTNSTPLLSPAAIDTTVFRQNTASMRIGPNSTGVGLRNNPFGGVGQTYTVSFWIRTDASWNGIDNNSKIRFGNASNGSPISVCGYGGVKTSWTQVSCSHTVTSASPQITITVGNDGTAGNIWLDDFVLTVAG